MAMVDSGRVNSQCRVYVTGVERAVSGKVSGLLWRCKRAWRPTFKLQRFQATRSGPRASGKGFLTDIFRSTPGGVFLIDFFVGRWDFHSTLRPVAFKINNTRCNSPR